MSYGFTASPNMKANSGFDEVMIVNPYDPRSNNQQHHQLMRFHESPGYYGVPGYGAYPEPDQMAYYGAPGYAAYPEPDQMAYYGAPGYGAYPEPDQMAYYGESGYGGYVEPEQGSYGSPGFGQYVNPEMAAYEPIGYISEEQPLGWYPEMAGYPDDQPLAEPYPEGIGYYSPDISGYVRETATPAYNPGCPMPTNVAGFGDAEPFAGYQRPSTVNPTCEQFIP